MILNKVILFLFEIIQKASKTRLFEGNKYFKMWFVKLILYLKKKKCGCILGVVGKIDL